MTTEIKTTAVTKPKEERVTEYVPFGSKDAIKLTVAMVKAYLAEPTKSGKVCTDRDATKFVALCVARKLNPFEGDAFLIGYDSQAGAKFNLITAHQAFLKRAELSAEYDGMKSGIIVSRKDRDNRGQLIDLEGDFYLEGDVLMGGWATVYFKTRKVPMSKRIRLKRFDRGFGVWKEDPAGMICKCAEADALRSSFPTMLGGMYTKEEMELKEQQKPGKGVSAPIFTDIESTKVADKQPEPEAERTPVQDLTPAEKVTKLCESEGIKEADLIEFLGSIAMAEDSEKKIEDLSAETLTTVLDQWDEFSEKIKEVCG